MEARTVNNLPPAASNDETVRCLLAIELSKKSWIVAVNTPLSDKVSRHTLQACDWKGLLELIARIRTRAIQALNRPVEVISCYEAGYDGFWLHRLLEAHGVRNYVIDPVSVQVDRRARRVKTDSVDVGKLLRSLMAHLRGEPKVWSVVRVPSVAEEDDRRLHRERHRLINERVQHVNRIKGLCAVHGIYDYEPLRPNRLAWLEQLRGADGRELPPRLKAEIVRELKRLELVLNMIMTIEAECDAIALAGKSSTHANAKKIRDLIRRLNNLSQLLQAQGDLAGARPLIERALAIDEKVLGPEHSGTATDLCNLARLLNKAGHANDAEPLFHRAISIGEKALGRNHSLAQRYASHYALLLLDTARAAEALPVAQAALATHEAASGPNHPWTKDSACVTADALSALGRADEAAALRARYGLTGDSR